MNGGLGEVISQPPLHFDGVGVFPSSNSIKIKIMAGTTVTRQNRNQAPTVQPTQTVVERTGTIVANFTLNQFKLDFGVTKLEVKENPTNGKLCMYDGINVLGAVSSKWSADVPVTDLQIIKIEDEGEDIYVLSLRGSGGISEWDTLASY